jgi:hypothetical protein
MDLDIIDNGHFLKILAKGTTYHEQQTIKWKYNINVLIDSVEDYTRKWTKREKGEVDTVSEWVKLLDH